MKEIEDENDNNEGNRYLWVAAGLGAVVTLSVIFQVADIKQKEIDALNEHAVDTLALIDDVESKVGQYVPMSYEGSDYHIFLRSINTNTEANTAPETCYDFSINKDGETVLISGFRTTEAYRYECAIN